MPNWCMNNLTVSGNPAELKRFVESSMGFPAHYPPREWEKQIQQMDPPEDTPYFCFNALVPTPPEVLAIGSKQQRGFPMWCSIPFAVPARPTSSS